MDSPVIFDRLAESTTPHIKKTRSLGVEVATTESHLQETTAIFGYRSLFLLHHSNGFEFSVARELSMSTRYDFSCFCSRKSFTISGCTFFICRSTLFVFMLWYGRFVLHSGNKHPPHLLISTLSACRMAQCTSYTAKTRDVECL